MEDAATVLRYPYISYLQRTNLKDLYLPPSDTKMTKTSEMALVLTQLYYWMSARCYSGALYLFEVVENR